jgi:hypothetical protein
MRTQPRRELGEGNAYQLDRIYHQSHHRHWYPRAQAISHMIKTCIKRTTYSRRAHGKKSEPIPIWKNQKTIVGTRCLQVRVHSSDYENETHIATPRGFEPLRAEPDGFLVHLLSHSDKVS